MGQALRASAFAAMVGGFAAGWQAHSLWDKALAGQQVAHAARVEHAQAQVSQKAAEAHAEHEEQIRVVYRTLRQEVPTLVSPEVVDRYDIPVGYVRLFNAAAEGVPAVPDPAGRADEEPSGIGYDTLAGATIENGLACATARRGLEDLQAWLRAQQAVRSADGPAAASAAGESSTPAPPSNPY